MAAAADEAENEHGREEGAQRFMELGVCKELADAAAQLGWHEPTEIQKQAIPLALKGKDVVGLAHTGSGKTGAFALPALHQLLDKPRSFDTLVLSPTRELALQIAEQFEALGAHIQARVAALVGGVDHVQQSVQLGKRPHVVVGTPGRVTDHLENTKGFSISKLQHLVLDEADRLLDMDFEDEIDKVLKVRLANSFLEVLPLILCTALLPRIPPVSKPLSAGCMPRAGEENEKAKTRSCVVTQYLPIPRGSTRVAACMPRHIALHWFRVQASCFSRLSCAWTLMERQSVKQWIFFRQITGRTAGEAESIVLGNDDREGGEIATGELDKTGKDRGGRKVLHSADITTGILVHACQAQGLLLGVHLERARRLHLDNLYAHLRQCSTPVAPIAQPRVRGAPHTRPNATAEALGGTHEIQGGREDMPCGDRSGRSRIGRAGGGSGCEL